MSKLGFLKGKGSKFQTQVSNMSRTANPETASPLLDNTGKVTLAIVFRAQRHRHADEQDVEQTQALLELILKSFRRQQKHSKAYADSGEDLGSAFEAYGARIQGNGLPHLLELAVKWEHMYQMLVAELNFQNQQVQELIQQWLQTGFSKPRAEKKKFAETRRALDNVTSKFLKVDGSRDPQKMKELQGERESAKAAYLAQGEKRYFLQTLFAILYALVDERSYNTLLDTIEQNRFNGVDQMYSYFSAYSSFFKTGAEWFEKHMGMIQEEKDAMVAHLMHIRRENLLQRKETLALDCCGHLMFSKNQITRAMAPLLRRVYATLLTEVHKRDNPPGDIIPFLHECFVYIEKHGLKTTGIFRVSPPKPALDAIRAKIDRGEDPGIADLDEVHMVTGLVKLFLRELPDPLMQFSMYNDWMEAAFVPEPIPALKKLIDSLPTPNRVLLHRLIHICTLLLANKEINMMTESNLAIVLCPSILYSDDPDPITMVANIQKANQVMEKLILNYDVLFPGPLPVPPGSDATQSPSVKPAASESGTPEKASGSPKNPLLKPSNAPTKKRRSSRRHSQRRKEPPVPPPRKRGSSGTSSASAPATIENSPPATEKGPFEDAEDIEPALPPIPLAELYEMTANVPDTTHYYIRLYELFVGAYKFTCAAFNIDKFTQDELNALNLGFQAVGKAIKNMIAFIKEYAKLFPIEISKRVLLAANNVRPHIKGLIAYIKAFNNGTKEAGDLLGTTRQFLSGTQQLFLSCHIASQMDAFSQTGLKCKKLSQDLFDIFSNNPTRLDISLLVNNLQNFTLMFTSVLRARLARMDTNESHEKLSVLVEKAEAYIGEVFDEARVILVENQLTLTPVLEEKLKQLSTVINDALRPQVAFVQSEQFTVPHLLGVAREQIDSITELHQEEEDENMLGIVLHFSNLSNAILNLSSSYETRLRDTQEFFHAASKVVVQLTNIRESVERVASVVKDDSLRMMLEAFIDSLDHCRVQFKLTTATASMKIRIKGDQDIDLSTPLLDLAFIAFPFMYNLRDACTLG